MKEDNQCAQTKPVPTIGPRSKWKTAVKNQQKQVVLKGLVASRDLKKALVAMWGKVISGIWSQIC